jgi:hypothetical protein
VLGHFVYSDHPADDCMLIEMRWRSDDPIGVLHVPPSVTHLIEGSNYEQIQSGESLALPIALGLGVILAGLTNTDLVLSGDTTAWKTSWGSLRPDFNDVELQLRKGADVAGGRRRRFGS